MYLQRWHGWCHMKLLPSRRVLCTPYNHAPCHFMQSQIHKVYACLAVTCHLHFWQNDQDLLRATAVTQERCMHAVCQRQERFMHAVCQRHERFMHAVCQRQERECMQSVRDKRENACCLSQTREIMHAVCQRQERYVHAVCQRQERYMHAVCQDNRDTCMQSVRDKRENACSLSHAHTQCLCMVFPL